LANYDESLLDEKEINIVVQFNGKKRGILNTLKNSSEEHIIELIKKDEKLNKYLLNKEMKRKIYVKDKLINIIL
jgi:Leucyl-tRNA synthetase